MKATNQDLEVIIYSGKEDENEDPNATSSLFGICVTNYYYLLLSLFGSENCLSKTVTGVSHNL